MTPIHPTRTPRTGRRPGTSTTREAILEAARKLFAERGYAGATMRAIATEAGVDAALVVHFFGSKAGLLADAIEWPFDPDVEMPKLLAGGRKHVGGNLVRLFVTSWDRDGERNPILTLLRAATIEPQAAEMLREFVQERLYPPLFERLGSDQPELRTDLVVSQLIGVAVARYILKFEPLASAKQDDVVAWIGPTIQRYLTGKLSHDPAR
jgi:AcrR family transcriptional regulator